MGLKLAKVGVEGSNPFARSNATAVPCPNGCDGLEPIDRNPTCEVAQTAASEWLAAHPRCGWQAIQDFWPER